MADEKRLTRARRAVEKAATLLGGTHDVHRRRGALDRVTAYPPPANWYPDPEGPRWAPLLGRVRMDGAPDTTAGTPFHPLLQGHPGSWGKPPWKGADLGLPAFSVRVLFADQARRLGGRMIDILVVAPVFVILLIVTLLIAAPHFGPSFPPTRGPDGTTTNGQVPGFVWFYLVMIGCLIVSGLVMLAYQTIAVGAYGRTLGQASLDLRPVRLDGTPLGWGHAFTRALIFWLAGFLGWIGLLDPLWCLWDDRRQCLHDKVAGSIVINDRETTPPVDLDPPAHTAG